MTTIPTATSYRRGDVVLAIFPNANLKTAKLRPVLIIQANDLQTSLPQVIVAMITSKMFRANHLSRVAILRSTSVVMTDNLATIAEAEIERGIGTLPMMAVDAALKHTLNL